MARILLLALPLLAGCLWVTRAQYEEAWDKDGDGWGLEQDCDDDNPDVHPHAPDHRGDGCDADCGTAPDGDGDDWPDDADCAPDDPTAYPCSREESAHPDVDCDGLPGISRPVGDCDGARGDPSHPAGASVPLDPTTCRPPG